MEILLVEPWFGGSHRGWVEGYARHSRHDVELLTLPAEGWKWRMRGGALTLARQVVRRPDAILASSLLDLASFLGHARQILHDVPVVLYMHENQLTYPVPDGATRDTSLALVNWNAMAVADRVVFNTEYHRRVWFEAVEGWLGSHPDPRHDGIVAEVASRATVLPVGVELGWLPNEPAKPEPPLILWNQRWEHDKDPDAVAAIVTALADRDLRFRVALCGESPHGATPPPFARLADRLGPNLIHLGFADRRRYEVLLAEAAIVLSAAQHEFFGVAVVEAMAAGAVPVLPDRLSYPELVDGLTECLYRHRAEAIDRIEGVLNDPDERTRLGGAAATAARRFDWRKVAPRYDELLESL
jgi:glycosyltransferase involved in cell wall biosynthesis